MQLGGATEGGWRNEPTRLLGTELHPLRVTPPNDMFSCMGITIHYKGQLSSEAAYQDLVGLVSSIAEAEGWLTEPIASGEVTLHGVRDEQDRDYIGPVKGIVVYLHEDCDPVRLEFDRDLYLQEFTKTQFAGVQVHLDVVKLLKAIQPFFHNLDVEDEGEWWETGDTQILTEHLARAQKAIETELRKDPSARMKVKTPTGRIMDLIT